MDKILKQFGEEKIINVVAESNSFVEATIKLELKPHLRKNVERSIKRLGLLTDHFESVKRLKDAKTRYTKEKLEILVKNHKNYKEILEELDVLPITTNYNRLKKKLNEYKIDFSHLKNSIQNNIWNDKELLLSIINDSKSQKEVLEKMKIRSAGGNFRTLQKYINLFDSDTSHFTKCYEHFINKPKLSLDYVLIENSTYDRGHLKERLYENGLKERKCELCGQGEEWNGKHMSLILDHQNGIYNDNRIENLRIVCPNCNATLDTHAGKNVKRKVKPVKKDLRLEYHISRRKVERPSLDILKKEISSLGLEGTGRKYNVTGNSIKKWVKSYEKYGV